MRRVTKLSIIGLVVCCAILALATAQQGDILVLEGKRYSIHTNPLESYLQDHPEKRPKSNVVSSSLWRGYVATWEVRDGHFLLVDVSVEKSVSKPGESGFSTERVSVMSAMFPDEKAVPATWFSGHVIIPNGKLVNYVHMGYASTYEKYIVLRVEKGMVTQKSTPDADGFIKFRNTQFALYKKTDEYRKAMAETAKEGSMTPEQNEEFLREFYSERYMSMIFDNTR